MKREIIWNDCDVVMPDADMVVLTFAPNDCCDVWPAVWNGERWEGLSIGEITSVVTHWADLPEGPQ